MSPVARSTREEEKDVVREEEDTEICWLAEKVTPATTAIRLWSQPLIHSLKHSTSRFDILP